MMDEITISVSDFKKSYQEGMTYSELAKKYNVKKSKVAALVKELGLTGRGNPVGRKSEIKLVD